MGDLASKYTIEKKDDHTIVRHNEEKAEIEINNTVELRKILNNLIDSGETKILVDFKNITYIDSSGLGVMLDAMKRLNESNGEVGLLSISKDVLEVFTSTKIAQFFKFYKSVS